MRVLIVALPLIGHLFPMMPLAVELASSGHDVRIATGGDAVLARDSGIAVEDIWPLPRSNFGGAAVRALALHPQRALRGMRGIADPQAAGRVFAVVNRPMIEPVFALARRFAPDVIVHEPYAAAGAIAAARLGIASVLHNIALIDGAALLEQILLRLGARAAPAQAFAATLSIAPPSMLTVPGLPMRYAPYSSPGSTAPPWLHESATRPRILVTRSTMLGDGPNAMLDSVLRAAPQVDAEIVIVRPNDPIVNATRLPANVRTVGWIPLYSVLHSCTAILTHGGAGSVYEGLRAGIPQLATPAPGDRAWTAALVQQRGVGLSVPARKITATHLSSLISDPTMVSAAREVAAEIAAMPSVEQVAAMLTAQIAS
ncbi:glycosyltransferase [Antrihabitans cavernicola]|uniref:DUF1205 domain-containing protein n=1 Tax=Antrihabitans cavernicola TaxID=2495913 RepID=A0A5A7S3B7_9NOCA|nr:glycosyltransferase [Spelaeibacter cavernicola]KAA0017025.1 DUF1205 domain-containing protein [Spelaeibacter cavernicola]